MVSTPLLKRRYLKKKRTLQLSRLHITDLKPGRKIKRFAAKELNTNTSNPNSETHLNTPLQKFSKLAKTMSVYEKAKKNTGRKNRYQALLRYLDGYSSSSPSSNNTTPASGSDNTKCLFDLVNDINREYYESGSYSSNVNGVSSPKRIALYRPNPDSSEEVDMSPNVRYPPSFREQRKVELSKASREHIIIEEDVTCLKDLIAIADKYCISDDFTYSINVQALHNIKEEMVTLDNLIGMEKLKSNVTDQLIYFLQELHLSNVNEQGDFLHTVISGPPGTGKTEVAKIMGKMFSKLGILRKGTFRKVTRSDLVAGYLGQTAMKTRDVIRDSLGGVLFIDEAYALGNVEKRDSFSKECIDTLCEALSDHKSDLMVIIAGYEHELKECFFAYNEGLDSRFTWRFKVEDYTPEELSKIFVKKVNDIGWSVEGCLDDQWFTDNMDYFKFFGRDMETLLAKTKIAHSRRVFGKSESLRKKIIMDDVSNGFKLFTDNEEVKKRKEDKGIKTEVLYSMYS